MKKALFSIAALGISLFFVSCGTQINLADYSKTAITTVEGNQIVYKTNDFYEVKDEDKFGFLTTQLNTKINGSNPEIETAQDRVVYAEESLKRILEEINGLEFVEKDTVINSSKYKTDTLGFIDLTSANILAEGYKKGMSKPGKKSAKSLMKDIEANSLLSAVFEFDKRQTTNKVFAVAKMRVKFFDNKGKLIINKEYIAESENFIETETGVDATYDKDELVALFPEATDAVITKFAMDFIN